MMSLTRSLLSRIPRIPRVSRRSRLPLILLLIMLPLTFLNAQQGESESDTTSSNPSNSGAAESSTGNPGTGGILLSVSIGNPEQGGKIQQFTVNSGDTAFVSMDANQAGPQTLTQGDIDYNNQLIQINNQISSKIAELNAAQKAIDTQMFPVQRQVKASQKALIQNQLQYLEMQRDQLQTDHASQQAQQQLNTQAGPPPAGGNLATGLNIKANVSDNNVTFVVNPAGSTSTETTVQGTVGQWSRVSDSGKGVWAKVETVNQ